MDQFYGKYGKYAKIKGFRIPDKEIDDMFKGLIDYPKRRVKDYCHAFYHVYNVNPGDDPKLDFFYKHLLIACENIGLII